MLQSIIAFCIMKSLDKFYIFSKLISLYFTHIQYFVYELSVSITNNNNNNNPTLDSCPFVFGTMDPPLHSFLKPKVSRGVHYLDHSIFEPFISEGV